MRDLRREESNIVQLAQGNADKEGYEGLQLNNDGNATQKYQNQPYDLMLF